MKKLSILSLLLSSPTFACIEGNNDMIPTIILNKIHISEDFKEKIKYSKNIEIKIEDNIKSVCYQGEVDFKYGIYLDKEKFYFSHSVEKIKKMMDAILDIKINYTNQNS